MLNVSTVVKPLKEMRKMGRLMHKGQRRHWMDRRMDTQWLTDGWMNDSRQADKWMDEWMAKWMDRWMNNRMMDRLMDKQTST